MIKVIGEAIGFICIGIIIAVLFTMIKGKVTSGITAVVKEKFSGQKLLQGMLNVTDKVGWAKDLSAIFNLRKLTIYTLILGVFFAYGYWKGQCGKPVQFDLRGQEATVKLNEHYLRIEKDGTAKVLNSEGKVLKVITPKDIPELSKALKPYGFEVKPIGVAGVGVGSSGARGEVGGGVTLFKYHYYHGCLFATNEGAYIGVKYKVERFIKWLKNTSVIGGYGKGYNEGDNRVIVGGSVEF